MTRGEDSIAPTELADELAAGESVTVLDLREDPEWGIEADGVTAKPYAPSAVLADPASVARQLTGRVAVLCNRGRTAAPVAQLLREHGVEALVVEGGIRGWIAALQDRPVALGLRGLEVRQVQRPGRGCLSYLLACDGEALVIDPAPDAGFYVELAAALGARVTGVFDTHLHADHLSGARMICERTGARLMLPAPALDRGVAYAQQVTPLRDGEEIRVGRQAIRALALPGHTTDMTGLLLADRALIGGDSLFVDGIARPDLQQSDPEGAREMARVLFATLHERVLALDGRTLLLPGHAHPGVSATAILAPLSQVARAVPELALEDPSAFAEALLAEMPPRPSNYEAIIAVNAGRHPFDPELESGGNSCSTR